MCERGTGGDVNSNVLISHSTGDAQLDKAVWQWLSWDKVRGEGCVDGWMDGWMCVGGVSLLGPAPLHWAVG